MQAQLLLPIQLKVLSGCRLPGDTLHGQVWAVSTSRTRVIDKKDGLLRLALDVSERLQIDIRCQCRCSDPIARVIGAL